MIKYILCLGFLICWVFIFVIDVCRVGSSSSHKTMTMAMVFAWGDTEPWNNKPVFLKTLYLFLLFIFIRCHKTMTMQWCLPEGTLSLETTNTVQSFFVFKLNFNSVFVSFKNGLQCPRNYKTWSTIWLPGNKPLMGGGGRVRLRGFRIFLNLSIRFFCSDR